MSPNLQWFYYSSVSRSSYFPCAPDCRAEQSSILASPQGVQPPKEFSCWALIALTEGLVLQNLAAARNTGDARLAGIAHGNHLSFQRSTTQCRYQSYWYGNPYALTISVN